MRIAGISATEPSTRARDRERDGKQATENGFSTRSRFSSTHVIVDLSREAMKQIGHDPLSRSRPAKPLLFIYDHSGALVYDDPAPIHDVHNSAPLADRSIPGTGDADTENTGSTIPNIVTFDGMLGTPTL